jgi:hypothetical protein
MYGRTEIWKKLSKALSQQAKANKESHSVRHDSDKEEHT